MKKLIRVLACVLIIPLLLAAGYVSYVLLSYHRLGSGPIPVEGAAAASIETGKSYTLLSWNVGFGAYEADYGFFMDGGSQSWAWSKERLEANLEKIASLLAGSGSDFVLLQEVDCDSTRTYHVDERPCFISALPGKAYTYARNYDSPFLFYPFTQPHGASKSGLMTFSPASVSSAERIELPVEEGLTKFLDLDRCYEKNRIPTAQGGELILYNLHLSAYTSDGTVATEQLKLLLADMADEYQKGNYCVAGGDFNKDLLGDSSLFFGKADREYAWTQPIPAGTFDPFPVSPVAPLDKDNPVPSCRNADGAYHPGQYVLTVDGFLVSDNVTVLSSGVIDTAFAFSDHNPVRMEFLLENPVSAVP